MSHNPIVTRAEWIDRLRVPPVVFNALRNASEKIDGLS
jgi:hypothetical protein